MAKSAAIVTGASQGIGHATAIGLARDFSALTLIARNRANLEQTAEAAVGTINAAIVALAKAFSDRGISDGVRSVALAAIPCLRKWRANTGHTRHTSHGTRDLLDLGR